MSISINTSSFSDPVGSMIHGLPQLQDFELPSRKNHFWGVIGGSVSFSKRSFRGIVIPVTFHNFATETALRTHINNIRANQALNGTLNFVNYRNEATAYAETAFLGFDEDDAPRFDGLGKHLWFQSGKLKFIQIGA